MGNGGKIKNWKKKKKDNSETIFLPVVKWTSAIEGDLARMSAKSTHSFHSLNGSNHFQLESRSEEMKIDHLSQLVTFTCRYLLKYHLTSITRECFICSVCSDILYRHLELLKQNKKKHCRFWNRSPQTHRDHSFSCVYSLCSYSG